MCCPLPVFTPCKVAFLAPNCRTDALGLLSGSMPLFAAGRKPLRLRKARPSRAINHALPLCSHFQTQPGCASNQEPQHGTVKPTRGDLMLGFMGFVGLDRIAHDTWSTVHASPGKLGFPGLARAGQAPGRSRACPLAPDLYP